MSSDEGDGRATGSPSLAESDERVTGSPSSGDATDLARPPVAARVVGIGASAGGLGAFRDLLVTLPPDSGHAFILVQHLDPNAESMLTELLRDHCLLRLVEADDGRPIEADTVYVIQPGTWLTVRDDRLRVEPMTHRTVPSTIDRLLCSLADAYGRRAAGVLLSGTGSDGTAGLRAIRAAGGQAIAQSPATAQHGALPRHAVEAGVVDVVASVERIVDALLHRREPSHPPLGEHGDDERQTLTHDALPEDGLYRLGALLRAREDFDLDRYKTGTVGRRICRRMSLVGDDDFEAYLDRLRATPEERQQLLGDLLIGVTDFFRDPEAWQVLRREAADELVRRVRPGTTLRVWVAGCSTGEEAYSVGILLLEAIEDAGRDLDLQIFATDVDVEALATARAGIYPPSSAEQLGPERLARYFTPLDGHGYKVIPRLRDRISFAVQDLCSDPPFSRMHLVTCRNVLIYLRRDVQTNVFRLLHFALQTGGLLFLGSSESLGQARDYLATVSSTWRIYRRIGASRPSNLPAWRVEQREGGPRRSTPPTPRTHHAVPEPSIGDGARDAILQGCIPPSVVVGADGRVLYVHGDVSPYVRLATGEARLDLLMMLPDEMRTRVRAAQYKARRDNEAVTVHYTRSDSDDEVDTIVRITVRPLPADSVGEDCVFIGFEDIGPVPRAAPRPDRDEDSDVAEQLERELRAVREDLRSTVEELETSNEELRASHEESMSMNEELQSANEELEATTEELRSLNEELTTVNHQLKEQMEQVQQGHDDIANFFASTKLATVFLDDQLCIKRYTPAAGYLLDLDHSQIGSRLGDLNRPLVTPELSAQARQVLDRLTPIERELETDDRWFILKALPYRTQTNRIEGVVLTFTEVSDLKRANRRLATRERQQAVVARIGMQALAATDLGDLFDHAVRQLAHTLETDFAKILELDPDSNDLLLRAGVGWRAGLVGHARVPADHGSQAGYTLASRGPVIVRSLADERRFHGPELLVEHGVVSGVSCTIPNGDGPFGVLAVHTRTQRAFTPDDANFLQSLANVLALAISRRKAEKQLRRTEARLSLALDASEAGVFEFDMETGVVSYVSDRWAEIFGHAPHELPPPERLGAWILDRIHPEDQQRRALDFEQFADTERSRHSQRLRIRHRDGGWRHLELAAVANRRDSATRPTDLTGVLFDVTAQEQARERLRQSEERFRVAMLSAPMLFYTLDLDHRVTWIAGPHAERWPAEQVIGHPESAFLPRSAARRLDALHRRVRVMGEGVRGELSVEFTNGVMHFDVVVEPLRQGEALVGLSICAFDITARKQTEEALRESETRHRRQAAELNVIYDTAPIGLALLDPELRYVRVNQRLAEYNGLDADAHRGRTMSEIAPRSARVVEPLLRHVITHRQPVLGVEVSATTAALADGDHYWRCSYIPLLDADGALEGISCFVENIDDRKAHEHALAEAAQHKDLFLAMLGHELRNPLAIIRTSVALQRVIGDVDERLRETVQLIDRQVTYISRLVDDLLDVSRIARGKIRLQLQRVELGELIRTVAADLRPTTIGDSQRALLVEVEDTTIWVEGDPTRLAQAVGNLVHNAVKFTADDGQIIIRLVRDVGRARLSIIDDGIGIHPDVIETIFEPFRQAEQGIDRARGGLGLGLSLVKGIIELHLGHIDVETSPDGTAFHIELPLVGAPSRTFPPVPRPAGRGRRVLLVEDHPDTRAMVKAALELRGHTVALARDARSALDLLDEWVPDVVICDLGLPGELDGLGFARAVRARDDLAPLYLIALTGYASQSDRDRARAAGFDLHLAKPADLDHLDAVVREAPGGA